MKKKLKAIVLTAGMGSRLNEVTKHIPKSMIKINGKYIFAIIAQALVKAGIHEVVFVVGYRRRELMAAVSEELAHLPLRITFVTNEQYKDTNTMFSLWLARHELDGPFLYLHGDLLFGAKMLQNFLEIKSQNSILVDTGFPLDWDDAMKIISHRAKLKYMSKAITVNEMDGIAIGIYKFNKEAGSELLRISEELIKKGVLKSWISESINILAKTVNISVVKNQDGHPWVDVDNLTDLNMGKVIEKKIERY